MNKYRYALPTLKIVHTQAALLLGEGERERERERERETRYQLCGSVGES